MSNCRGAFAGIVNNVKEKVLLLRISSDLAILGKVVHLSEQYVCLVVVIATFVGVY